MELPYKLGNMVRWRRRNWGRSMACCDGDRRVAARQHGLWRTRLEDHAPLKSRTTRLEDLLFTPASACGQAGHGCRQSVGSTICQEIIGRRSAEVEKVSSCCD